MIAAAALVAIRIGVLGIFAPAHVEVAAAGAVHDVTLDGARLLVDGSPRAELRVAGRPLVEVKVLGEGGAPRIARRYPGTLTVRPGRGALTLINDLDDEAYLSGTIALEAAGDHPEALRAQAVLARTLAAAGARHGSDGYDLCDLTHCQLYQGKGGETDAARAAARATAREVVLHADGRLAPVHFTGACGGATADAADVWPDAAPLTHLRSVPCDACQRRGLPLPADDPHASRAGKGPAGAWTADLPLADVDRALGAAGRLTGLTVVARGAGGHVRAIRLDGPLQGVGRTLTGEDFRIRVGRALGWRHLRSARFTVEPRGDRLHFSGRGAGHGVGVCVFGAAALARAGWGYRAILAHYLPGTRVAPR